MNTPRTRTDKAINALIAVLFAAVFLYAAPYIWGMGVWAGTGIWDLVVSGVHAWWDLIGFDVYSGPHNAGASWFGAGFEWFNDKTGPGFFVEEDSPLFNCYLHGNQDCGQDPGQFGFHPWD
jgi:hypothetical protein